MKTDNDIKDISIGGEFPEAVCVKLGPLEHQLLIGIDEHGLVHIRVYDLEGKWPEIFIRPISMNHIAINIVKVP